MCFSKAFLATVLLIGVPLAPTFGQLIMGDGVEDINILLKNPSLDVMSRLTLTNELVTSTNNDFHTDVVVKNMLDTVTSKTNDMIKLGSVVTVDGKVGYSMSFGGGISCLAGLPGTRMEISTLTNDLYYAGRLWRPTSKPSYVVCATNGLIGVNVEAREAEGIHSPLNP